MESRKDLEKGDCELGGHYMYQSKMAEKGVNK